MSSKSVLLATAICVIATGSAFGRQAGGTNGSWALPAIERRKDRRRQVASLAHFARSCPLNRSFRGAKFLSP